jgi:hypothetical protein
MLARRLATATRLAPLRSRSCRRLTFVLLCATAGIVQGEEDLRGDIAVLVAILARVLPHVHQVGVMSRQPSNPNLARALAANRGATGRLGGYTLPPAEGRALGLSVPPKIRAASDVFRSQVAQVDDNYALFKAALGRRPFALHGNRPRHKPCAVATMCFADPLDRARALARTGEPPPGRYRRPSPSRARRFN